MLDFTEYTKIFLSLFAILDPIGIIPIIIAFTIGLTAEKRARVGRMASLSVVGILLVALLIGELMLEFFGISIHSFRVAGGILLLLMSITMLFGNKEAPKPPPLPQAGEGANESHSESDNYETGDNDAGSSIAIVPLSTPLLAGPGAISTVILDAHKGHGLGHYAVMSVEIILLGITVWLTFLVAPWISQRLGRLGSSVFSRLMGLLLAAIAVEFIAGGLRGLFPILG
ncbi:MAG: NAAT family transporter [Gallionellaceae bacterium]|nr:NAAT family transporter [Gallionellaceae bacterium]